MTDFVTVLHRTIKGSSALILLLVGIFDTYLSWLYSYKWLYYIGSGTFISGLFAMILVLFAIISFEYAVLSLKRNKNKLFIAFLFFFWACLAFYSMQSTVASQYIDYTEAEYERTLEISSELKTEQQIEEIDNRIQNKRESIANYQERIAQYQKVISDIPDIETMGTWRTTVKQNEERIRELEEIVRQYEQEIRELEKQKDLLLQESLGVSTEKLEKNVFQFYEDLFSLQPNKIQFFLAVFKAVVLDLINILCFLFLTLEYVREEKAYHTEQEVPKEPIEEPGEPEIKRQSQREPLTFKQAIIFFIDETFERMAKGTATIARRVIGYQLLNSKKRFPKKYYDRIINVALSKGLIEKGYKCHMVKKNKTKEDFYRAFFR